MIVIDDYLNQNQFLAMRLAMDAASFPWEKSMVLKDPPAHIKPDDNQQSIHGFYLQNSRREYASKQFGILKPLLDKLNPLDLIKVKVNMTTQKDRHIEYGLHVDTQRLGATTAIFYLNTNNGYTLFEGGEKVLSVANRLVMFDAATPHTGASCTDTPFRLVLNLNMFMSGNAPE